MSRQDLKPLKELLDQMQAIDPLGAVVIASAGVAGACGVKGPLTTITEGIAGMFGGEGSGPGGAQVNLPGIQVLEWWNYFFTSSSSPSPSTMTDSEKNALITAIGNATGNMVEAGIMYTLVKNPETLRTIADITKQAANGAMGLAKAGAALLK